MKIAHLTNFYPLNTVTPPVFSGSERYVHDMATRQAAAGHEVHVTYTPVIYSPEHKDLKFLHPEGAAMSYFPQRVKAIRAFNDIRKFNPDVIQSHNLKMGAIALGIGLVLRKPVVCSVLLSENHEKGWKRKLFTKLLGPLFAKINYIAISEDIAESIRADVKNAKIDVVTCWTWNNQLIKNADGAEFRKSYPKNAKITFTISRIDHEKGLTYLFEAAKAILQKRNDVYFVISGGGPQLDEYRELVRNMGIEKNVVLTGRITDIQLLQSYNGCDMIVYPSPMDYLFSVSESLASGKPIVATRVRSAAETYKDRENALLVNIKDSKDLERAITELLENENLAEKIASGLEETAKAYHPDVCMAKIENVYKRITGSAAS